MVFTSALWVICALVGGVAGGEVGTMRGAALGTWIGMLFYWWQFRLALQEYGKLPAGSRFWWARSAGRHRSIPTPALTLSPDLTVLPDHVPKAAASTQATTIRSLPPTPVLPSAGQRPPERTATRPSVPRGAAKPHRRVKRSSAAARALLATGAMVVLAVAAATGWRLAHESTGTHGSIGASAPASVPVRAPTPANAHAPTPASARALKPVSAVSFDPYGDSQGENSQLASLAIDASPTTAWHTDWYTTARFGNLKPGTGLLLDMGQKVTITGVRLLLGSTRGADLQLRAGDTASSLRDLRPVARATDASGHVHLQLNEPAHGRYVLIWFIKLPPDTSGTFQLSVYNVILKGWR